MLHLPLRELQSMQKGDDYFADTLLLDLADGSSADHCSFFHSSPDHMIKQGSGHMINGPQKIQHLKNNICAI